MSIDDGDLELNSARLDVVRELFDVGALTPVLGRIYPIEQIVEAQRFVEGGHKRGGIAVTIKPR